MSFSEIKVLLEKEQTVISMIEICTLVIRDYPGITEPELKLFVQLTSRVWKLCKRLRDEFILSNIRTPIKVFADPDYQSLSSYMDDLTEIMASYIEQ
jgi:hypothetical protein